jgi:ATP-binding cassette subfamily C (CFTR/MRP) protein 1
MLINLADQIANALGIFTPATTLVLYALVARVSQSKPLDAETAFPVVAILLLVTHPANMVMTVVPKIMACLASFERIQAYLVIGTTTDQREIIMGTSSDIISEELAIAIQSMNFDGKNNSGPLLRDIDLDVKKGSVTMCSGAVGSGKSLLVKIILGDVQFTSGSVKLSSDQIGICAQSAWLPNGTIKAIVCAFDEDIDEVRYEEAISACCLEQDLENLSKGEHTTVGSRGMNLSGGQRQRVVRFTLKT